MCGYSRRGIFLLEKIRLCGTADIQKLVFKKIGGAVIRTDFTIF